MGAAAALIVKRTAGSNLFETVSESYARLWTLTSFETMHICGGVHCIVLTSWPFNSHFNQALNGIDESYSTDTCVSIIAIAGSPDYRYLQESDSEIDIFDDGEEFVCELKDGRTIPIRGTGQQMEDLRAMLHDGTLISSEMTIGVSDNLIVSPDDEDAVFLPPGQVILAPRGDDVNRRLGQTNLRARRDTNDGTSDNRSLRWTRSYEGNKPVLVVRVTDVNGKVHEDTPDIMSDKIFGTYTDSVNLKSQFAACSYDKLRVTNDYTNLSFGEGNITQHLVAPGVIDVNLTIDLVGSSRSAVRSAMIMAANAKLGFTLPGPFEHVMFVVERCYTECGWAAYAYVNSWMSVYQGNNYKYVGVQMHEVSSVSLFA